MRKNITSAVAAALWGGTLSLIALPVSAQSVSGQSVPGQSAPGLGDIAQVELLPGWRIAPDTHMGALRIRLAPGWKTYWRAPGDSGIPPRFDWTKEEGIAAQQIYWPTPKVFDTFGLRSVGYKGDVILPMKFTTTGEGEDLTVEGRVDLGICEDICVPVSVELSQTFSADLTTPDPAIEKALAHQPDQAAIRNVSCEIGSTDEGLSLAARIEVPALGAEEFTVFELPDKSIWIDEATSSREGDVLLARTELVAGDGKAFPLDGGDIHITVIGKDGAAETQGCTTG